MLWRYLLIFSSLLTLSIAIPLTVATCQRFGRGYLAKCAVSCGALLFTAVILELVFMHVADPNTGGRALSERVWFERYWNPYLNELGYRDLPVADATLGEGFFNILFLGDSFTAGHGVLLHETISSRVRDYLQSEKSPANVYCLGKNGSDTRDELDRLQEFPVQPDIVVFQYFGNDIQEVAAGQGYEFSFRLYGDVPVFLRPLVEKSYLLNWVYWRLPHPQWSGTWYANMTRAYQDPQIFELHAEDIRSLVESARMRSADVVALLYPNLQDVKISDCYMNRVQDILAQLDVEVLNVQELSSALPVEQRVVGAHDGHPSALLNSIVAAALLRSETFRQHGLGKLVSHP